MREIVFVPFSAFVPSGSSFGEGLVRADNSLFIHGGLRPIRKIQSFASVTDGPPTRAFVHIFQAVRAEQVGRAVDNDFAGPQWFTSPAGLQPWEVVDEETPDDTDFFFTKTPTLGIFLVVEALETPSSTTGVYYTFRYEVVGTGGASWDFDFDLDDGVGTVHAHNESGTGDTAGVVEVTATLTPAEAAAVSGWNELLWHFLLNTLGASATSTIAPTADAALGNWRKLVSGTPSATNLFQAIDESSPSDTDLAQSGSLVPGGAIDTYRASWGVITDPLFRLETGNFTYSYRYRATETGCQVVFKLKSGSTLIKQTTHASASTSLATVTANLTAAQVDAIDWSQALTLEWQASWPSLTAPTITQVGTPSSDISAGDWTPDSGLTLWEMIDADDANSINLAKEDLPGTFEVLLSGLLDPAVDTDHVIRIKARRVGSGSITLTFALKDGATTVATTSQVLTATLTQFDLALGAAQVAALANYSDARISITASGADADTQITLLSLRAPQTHRVEVSWAQWAMPSAAAVRISWAELRTPQATTVYTGDKPVSYAGTEGSLYTFDAAGFTDVSKAGGYSTGAESPGSWDFAPWGEDVVATNYVDPVQIRSAGAGLFANLFTSTFKPKCRFITIVRERLVYADINETGYAADQVGWTAPDDITDADPSPTTGADIQAIRSRPGQIMGLLGGERGIVLKRNSLHLMSFTGDRLVFRFDDISPSVGCACPRSIVEQDGSYFFWNGGGFYQGDDGGAVRIGDEAITRYLTDAEGSADSLEQIQPESIAVEDQLIEGARCPHTRRLVWHYHEKGGTAFRHTRAVAYDPTSGLWSPLVGLVDVAALATIPNVINSDTHLLKGLVGLTWDGTDTAWFKLSGSGTYAQVFETKIRDLGQEGQAVIRGVKPVVSYAGTLPEMTVTVTGGYDQSFAGETDSETAGPELANSRGIYPFRVAGYFFKFKVDIAGSLHSDTSMFKLDGLYVEFDLEKGRR